MESWYTWTVFTENCIALLLQSGGVIASASSKNITTSIFRRGVEFAVDEALLASNSLRGVKPTKFIPGLALFLKIEDDMALDIVHETVASKSRSLLLEVLNGNCSMQMVFPCLFICSKGMHLLHH